MSHEHVEILHKFRLMPYVMQFLKATVLSTKVEVNFNFFKNVILTFGIIFHFPRDHEN